MPGISEELLFRGVIQRNFEWRLRPVHAITLASLLFAMLHLQLANFIVLAIIGGYLGFLAWRTGSVIPSIAAHIAFNAIMITGAYLYPEMLEVRRYTVDDLMSTLPTAGVALALLIPIIAWLNRRYTLGTSITLER
jgi:membrane protease YdiL (CAAX protease family)